MVCDWWFCYLAVGVGCFIACFGGVSFTLCWLWLIVLYLSLRLLDMRDLVYCMIYVSCGLLVYVGACLVLLCFDCCGWVLLSVGWCVVLY